MSFIAVFLVFFFVATIVIAPLSRIEDRPAFKWPDRKPRRMT
jgi:hypothetical protein